MAEDEINPKNHIEAETTESLFEKELSTCKACKENLRDKEGYLLPCLHTLCSQCIENLTETQEYQTNGEIEYIKCPECEQVTRKKYIISNKFTSCLLPGDSAQDAEENKTCTGCEEGVDATSYCSECQEFLCDACVNAHKRVKITKDHTICARENAPCGLNTSGPPSALTTSELYCTQHPKEALRLFCESCDRLTCRDCQLQDHKDHKYYFVEEAGAKVKEVLIQMQRRLYEKKGQVECALQLIDKRSQEIEERREQVTNEVKHFALKIISEVNKRGKSMLSDLNAICNVKRSSLDNKSKGVQECASKIDYVLKFLEHAVDKGSNKVLLHSKKLLYRQSRNILEARCEVPNPNHKVDIRFNWDSNFATVLIPKQGMLLVDNVNFSGLPREMREQVMKGFGHAKSAFQMNDLQKAGSTSSATGGVTVAPNQHAQRPTSQYFTSSPHQTLPPQQQHRPLLQPRVPHPALASQNPAHMAPPQSGYGFTAMHQAAVSGAFNHPQQSATISSSIQRSMVPTQGNPFIPQHSVSYQNQIYHQQQLQRQQSQQHYQQLIQQQQRAHPSQQQHASQRATMTLAQLQEERMRRAQAHGVSSTVPPPSPIVIQPVGDENSRHLVPASQALSVAAGSSGGAMRPGSSPLGCNTPSPQQVGSTTGISPDRMAPPTAHTVLPELQPRMKPESTTRPACAGSQSGSPSAHPAGDQRYASTSLRDFTFDQDPMSFIKSITQEFDIASTQAENSTRSSTNEAIPTSSSHALSSSPPAAASNSLGVRTVDSHAAHSSQVHTFPSSREGTTQQKRSHTLQVPDERGGGHSDLKLKISLNRKTGKDLSQLKASSRLESQDSNDPSEDWCAVCNNGGDLLCCDRCPKVFHLECHIPTLRKAPSGEWFCNLCESVDTLRLDSADVRSHVSESGATKRKQHTGLTDREMKVCQRILLELFASRDTPPFQEQVSPSVPHYYEIINNPMDLGTIKKKLRRSHPSHYESIEDFLMDVQLVFTNCARYNAADSEMGVIGRDVEAFFHSLVRKILPYIDIQPVTSATTVATTTVAQNSTSTESDMSHGPAGSKVQRLKRRRSSANSQHSATSWDSTGKDRHTALDIESFVQMMKDGDDPESVLDFIRQASPGPSATASNSSSNTAAATKSPPSTQAPELSEKQSEEGAGAESNSTHVDEHVDDESDATVVDSDSATKSTPAEAMEASETNDGENSQDSNFSTIPVETKSDEVSENKANVAENGGSSPSLKKETEQAGEPAKEDANVSIVDLVSVPDLQDIMDTPEDYINSDPDYVPSLSDSESLPCTPNK